MLLDRMGLSAKNDWYDDTGRVYIYYTLEEICADMTCGRDKAMKLLLTVYGRFFRLYMFTALAPLPLASFAGEGTSASGKAFLRSYTGVCLEEAVIVLACLIYSAFLSSSSPAVDGSLPAVTMVWQYVGQLIFNMMILTGLVKGADRIVKEMLGL